MTSVGAWFISESLTGYFSLMRHDNQFARVMKILVGAVWYDDQRVKCRHGHQQIKAQQGICRLVQWLLDDKEYVISQSCCVFQSGYAESSLQKRHSRVVTLESSRQVY